MKLTFNLCALALLVASRALGAPSNVQTNAQGVLLHFGTAQVELAAANDHTFRLSVSLSGAPNPSPSIFLADTNAATVIWHEVKSHGLVGIRTAAGQLLMDPANGEWTLENADGQTLIPRYPIGNFNNATSSLSSLYLSLGWKANTPIVVYGCGNGTNSLQQAASLTGVSNRVTGVPYYWSATGYSVLAVTADDNRPAQWQSAPDGQSIMWTFPGPKADLYLMPAATLKDAARVDAQLTGYAPVPPLWAFGYLQSRWGWTNRAYIDDTLNHFLDLKLPVDAFIYDFEWYTTQPDYQLSPRGAANFHDFGWNPKLFPQPADEIKSFKDQGVHSLFIRKPRLGNSQSLEMMRHNHWELMKPEGTDMFTSRDANFSIPDFQKWYIAQSAHLLRAGFDGWWNDEGEGSYSTYYYWNLTEREGMDQFQSNRRLWTLNRAFSPGLQRLGAAAWTGDIQSSWDVLAATPTSLLNWTLAGMPYEACDIGGYDGNPSPELLTRWMQAGVFFPVMRSHSELQQTPRFPWLYGPDALAAIRQALNLRYQLIPYYYSLAHETAATGMPLMRPLAMEFPNDPHVANISDEWLMGPSLLAAPVLQSGGQRQVYLPDDTWYAFQSNIPLTGKRTLNVSNALDEISIYVRAGTILPLGPVIQHTSQLPGGPLELEIYPGKNATFTLVEDDGQTTDYTNGHSLRITFTWNDAAHKLSWTQDGDYAGPDIFKQIHIMVFDPRGKIEAGGALIVDSSVILRPQ